MNSFSFKKLTFFRGRDSAAKKPAGNGKQEEETALGFWPKLLRNPFVYLILFTAAIAHLISYLPSQSLPSLQSGDIASADIVAPENLTIEDLETTETRRREAREAVQPVYSIDPVVFANTESQVRAFFNSGRELSEIPITAQKIDEFNRDLTERLDIRIPAADLRSLHRLKFPAALEEALINRIGKIASGGIILSKDFFIHGENEKGLVLRTGPGEEIALGMEEILDLKSGKVRLVEDISALELPQTEKSLLIMLAQLFLKPNVIFDPIETTQRQTTARDNVETVFYTIKKGKVIVRKGDEISEEIIEQIELINLNLSDQPSWLSNFAGAFLLFILLLTAFICYLRTRPEPHDVLKRFLLCGSLLLLSLLLYKAFLFLGDLFSQNTRFQLFSHPESYRYAFPLQMGALLLSFLTGTHLAMIFTVINGIMVGYLLKSNFSLMVFTIVGGMAAICAIKYFGKGTRNTSFRAGLTLIAPLNVVTIIIIHLIRERFGPLDVIGSELLMGVLGGLLSGALAFLLLPVLENLFGIVTQSRLVELSNSDLPIFRKMAMMAPGSYHHSLIVASLGEAAAENIGLDPLLVKTGALYHDIGKIRRPEYFIENRTRKADMHRDLKPSMSALVIVNHVKEGLEQARKLRLPRAIREMIEQHHGNTLVRYFFEKAKEEYDPEMQKIGEENYRYPGPRPRSKEAALVMLADSVEAASRSIKKPTKTNLKRVITEIFNGYLQDGQLDDSDLSLRDLKIVADAFLAALFTIYHPRMEYPGYDFEGKKTRAATAPKNHDRNPQPTE